MKQYEWQAVRPDNELTEERAKNLYAAVENLQDAGSFDCMASPLRGEANS